MTIKQPPKLDSSLKKNTKQQKKYVAPTHLQVQQGK